MTHRLVSSSNYVEVSPPRIDGEVSNAGTSLNRYPVSIVIPCYNEEASMPYLGRTLDKLESELSTRYEPQFILVDYRSVDGWMGNNYVG